MFANLACRWVYLIACLCISKNHLKWSPYALCVSWQVDSQQIHDPSSYNYTFPPLLPTITNLNSWHLSSKSWITSSFPSLSWVSILIHCEPLAVSGKMFFVHKKNLCRNTYLYNIYAHIRTYLYTIKHSNISILWEAIGLKDISISWSKMSHLYIRCSYSLQFQKTISKKSKSKKYTNMYNFHMCTIRIVFIWNN